MMKTKNIHDGAGYRITKAGYPRFNSNGKFKGAYVHRHEAAKMLNRPLKKDEQVHHRNSDKLDFAHANLQVMGSREHGWISAKQAFYMNLIDIKSEGEFYAVLEAMEGEGGNLACGANA